MVGRRSNKKWIDLSLLLVAIGFLLLVNMLGSYVFQRFDLTQEGRYSLSESTVETLQNLEDVVFIRVYLEGNLPAEFRELRNSVKETLDELRAYSGGNLEYEFIDPSSSSDEKERVKVYEELTRQGLSYTNIRMREGDKVSEQIIFPGAIVTLAGGEAPVQLLKSQVGATQNEMITASIQELEYEFLSAIKKLSDKAEQRIAIIEGHAELQTLETADIEQALSEFYTVERIEIDEQLHALDEVDAIIVARPDSAISEKDKFILDQFVMNGGKSLWVIDPVFARMDSLKYQQMMMGSVLKHNLTDMLFKYGVRLNNDLILDLECLSIPIVTGQIGNQPRQEMFPWYYSPLLTGNQEHPISTNIDRIKGEFSSTMELLDVEGVSATPLLHSSDQCRLVTAPSRISFNILREAPRYEMFNTGPHIVGALLEGSFPSVFTNRLPKKIVDSEKIDFKTTSMPTKMVVLSDGDLIRNPIKLDENRYFTLGFDRYTNKVYGNREFILNAMNYLLDDSGLLDVRSKEFKIRLLDQTKIEEERYYWQILNTAMPILIVLLFGVVRMWLRKRKYAV